MKFNMWIAAINVKLLIISSMLLLLSNYSYSDVYKCRNADGHVTYQSMKCASGDISSKVKIVSDKVTNKKINNFIFLTYPKTNQTIHI